MKWHFAPARHQMKRIILMNREFYHPQTHAQDMRPRCWVDKSRGGQHMNGDQNSGKYISIDNEPNCSITPRLIEGISLVLT